MKRNKTLVTEFVLLFIVFLVIYLTTMLGNLGLMALIWKDAHLHTPMYFFLGGLAFADACTSTSVTPRMLVNFLDKTAMISLADVTTECFLLVAMAYDRYVSICNPLLYPVVMSNRLCTHLKSISYAIGFLHPLIHVSLLLRLTFCGSKIIHYFYCEILQLFKISCNDPPIKALMITIFAAFIQISTLMTMIISYTCVLFDVLKKKSEKGRSKAFSMCSAHLLSVSLYYGTLIFRYVCPASGLAEDQDKMYSLFYTIIIPLLNPFIYSLRNKEVIVALRRISKK
uniref:Olfactory receptor n=1 Tax=Balaenoptera musculus TaxID=9771 RepID=A0A8C0DF23_BALMU